MSLYTILQDIENFTFEIDEESGEIMNIDALEALEIERNTKIENVALYIKNLAAEAAAIREEEKALAERRKAKENKAEALKKYLAFCLNGAKFESAKVGIAWRRSVALEIEDGAILPLQFVKVKEEYDKTKIKEALKSGEVLEGCKLVERNNINIK